MVGAFFGAFLGLANWAAAQAPGVPVVISSATISDPHQLVGATIPYTSEFKALTAFPEDLVFKVTWGVFDVGEATLEVKELVEFNGRPAYHVVSRATSNPWCDAFYKVRDINESWIDARTLDSLGYFKKLREGRFSRDEWVLYDQERHTFLSKRVERNGSFTFFAGTTTAHVQDILSSMYFVRSHPLDPGQNIILDVNTRENWPLVVPVVKRQKVRVPAGNFQAALAEPALRHEGLFIQKGRKLQIWLADDAKKTPVMMKVEVFFGHISAKLWKMLQ